jgi:hypothetical protein
MADEVITKLEPLDYPEDLTGLSDEELEAAVAECLERSEYLADEKNLADLSTEEATELIENAVVTGEALDAEVAKREEAKAEQDQILEAARARLAKRLAPEDEDDPEKDGEADDDPEAEGDAKTPEGDADEADDDDDEMDEAEPARERELEPALSAAKPNRAMRRSKKHEPLDAKPRGQKMIALADMPGAFAAGEAINMRQAAELVAERWNRSHVVDGPKQDVPLMRFSIDTPPERMLGEDANENGRKIYDAIGEEALVASGGICAPPEPYYDLQVLAGAQTPVVDSIPRFGAARGGILWMTPATLASITTGVGVITEANDTLGGTNATKTCQVIPCPAQNTAVIDAIYHCLSTGNMGARTYPEFVQHFTQLTMAAFARVRETKALDALKAGSTQVTQATVGGAAPTILGGILQAAEGMRSRHRMVDTAVLRAWFPTWALGLLAEDFIRRPYDRMEALDQGYKAYVTAKLRACQIAPTFYVDTETAGGMIFGTQTAAALLPFPSTVKWFLAPEGTFIRLDGGTLDLGMVRDSVLNATNDFQMFGEVFETYAKVGIESLEITTTTAGTGVVTAPA